MDINRAIILVLDGVGIGAQPDANRYFQRGPDGKPVSDEGAATLQNLATRISERNLRGICLPNLAACGLGRIPALRNSWETGLYWPHIKGVNEVRTPSCFYGKAAEISAAKDTVYLHWEMAGYVSKLEAKTYPQGFPREVIDMIVNASYEEEARRLGITPDTCKCLNPDYTLKGIVERANIPINGETVIALHHKEHVETGKLMIYTSADSVLQVAANEDIMLHALLNAICAKVRKLPLPVIRVISRPYLWDGQDPDTINRTENRHDFPMEPDGETLIDKLYAAKIPTVGLGKVASIFAYRVFSVVDEEGKGSNPELFARLLSAVDNPKYSRGLIFANLVHFDQSWGHTRRPEAFYQGLRDVDHNILSLFDRLTEHDLLFITADHGNDPTYVGSDHTREYVPLLVYNPMIAGNAGMIDKDLLNLGIRQTEADTGQTIAEALLGHDGCLKHGVSYLKQIKEAYEKAQQFGVGPF